MADSTPQYGANCPISLPETIDSDPGQKAEMGGFAFITSGFVHDITDAERDALLSQAYGPTGGLNG
jgi:hypothetical protein